MDLGGEVSRHLLMNPGFWRPRLEKLGREPRHLVLFPRPDLVRPGIDVLELRLRAHDGVRLTALLARSAFAGVGQALHLRSCGELAGSELDYTVVEGGGTDLIFRYPEERRLEDRVLDVVWIMDAACSVEGVDCSVVTLQPNGGCQDEFAIVRFLREEGWIARPPGIA